MTKILVVDDLAENRALVVTLINYRGHQALEAADGAEALALVRKERPELVISDILMPTMDGYEFVRQLRADPVLAATEVIFYSAHYREREARNLAQASGVSRVLIKPCEPEDILLAIDQALNHAPAPVKPPDTQEFDREHLRLMSDKLSEKVAELEAANRRLGALTDLNLQIASERDPRLLLEKVCVRARDLIGAKYAVLCVAGKIDGELIFFTSGIEPALADQLQCPDIGRGVSAQTLTEQHARRMTNLAGDATGAGLPAGYPALHSSLVAPVVSLTHAYGWIWLADKLGAQEFSEEDEKILSILAAQLGRIYENGRLYNEVKRHAVQLQLEVVERKRAEEELRESDRRFRDMLGNVAMVSTMLDREARITYCNDYLLRLTGWRHEEVFGRNWFEIFIPPDQEAAKVQFSNLLGNLPSAWHFENEIQTRAGGRRLIRWNNSVLRSPSGEVTGTASIGEDITDSKEAERKIRRLNRVYAVLSDINTLIVRVGNRDELFREACRIAVEHGQFKRAWIGMVDRETMKIVPLAAAGAEPEFLLAIRDRFPLYSDAPLGDTLGARAVREKKAIVSNDIGADPGSLTARESKLPGFAAMAFLPLLVSDEAVGVLALYADETGFFDDEGMRLLTELAGDIGFALDHIEKGERINYLAYYDEITTLPNRTLFLERVSQLLRMRVSGNNMTALALVDIARFRIIIDTFDRQAGDELLKQVAHRIQLSEVGFDTVARVGVNCFGVALCGSRDVPGVAHALEQLLRECFNQPFQLRGAELRIAAKAGIALYPLDGGDAETLFRNAEAALQRAKDSVEPLLFYAPEMNVRVAEALNLESRLRTALELDQFVLYYQPKVSLASGRLTGIEALIQWHDPRSGLMPPGHFIALLEETGLIYEVGRWALRKALDDNRRWRAAGLAPVRVAVNVSPLQLRHRGFISEVRQAIGTDPQSAAALELEITESLIMEDVNHSIATLQELRAMGITIAIDDFGTGFSSLSYLSRLPVDTLKIDRSFVIDMTAGPQGLALVSTIINLAHALKLKVVAEGVETEEQARLLRLLGCDDMQGFLFSKAVPSDILEARHLIPLLP
jgi:PAS domain S-box-containing protein/diguanylate cyclase (GGDEF)-like protein